MNWIEEKVVRLGRSIYAGLSDGPDDWQEKHADMWKGYERLFPAIASDIEKEYEGK